MNQSSVFICGLPIVHLCISLSMLKFISNCTVKYNHFIMSLRKRAPNLKTECHWWDQGCLCLQLLREMSVLEADTSVNTAETKPPNQAIKTLYHPRIPLANGYKIQFKRYHHSTHRYTTIHSLTFKLVDELYQSGLYLERKRRYSSKSSLKKIPREFPLFNMSFM